LSHLDKHPPLRRIVAELAFRSTIIPFSKACWDIEIEGAEELPPGPCFIYGNHSNNYDPFILNAFTQLGESTAGVMTMEYLESGPIAKLFQAAGIVGTRKRVPEPHLIRRIMRMLDAGRRVVIFPEGGRRWDGRPAPWIDSTAKLFMRAGAPVYPVEIIGSYVGWPRWAPWPRPAHIKLKVHPAVDFSDNPTLKTALDRLKSPISADENVVPEDIRPAWAWRPASGIDRLLYRDPESGLFGGLRVTGPSHLTNTGGTASWRVLPDSRLLDQRTGAIVNSGDLYEQITSMDLPGALTGPLISQRGRITVRDALGQQVAEFKRGMVDLFKDHLKAGDMTIPLETIRYMGLERSDYFWIMGESLHVRVHLTSGSVLAYYDTLSRLAPHINN